MCIYTWFAGIANSVVYSVETPLAEALGITVGDINAGTGYLFLLCGWGLLFWQPFALQLVLPLFSLRHDDTPSPAPQIIVMSVLACAF